jgi:two-component system, chemotaxis family, protein-glutamate methylesterase/glutaminase
MSTYKALVIGGSAGSFPLVVKILSSLPKNYPLPVFLCLHRLKHVRKGFVEALSIKSNIPIVEPDDKQTIKPGIAYLAPSNYHMLVEVGNTIALSTDLMVKYSRPSIDLTFDSVSNVYRDKLIAVIVSGANSDGADGMKSAKDRGAYTLVQDPAEATIQTMPNSAIQATTIDRVLKIDDIVKFLIGLEVTK